MEKGVNESGELILFCQKRKTIKALVKEIFFQ
jgi:hypothetical protein